MARETVTTLIDDLDGGEAHETVTFALDGHSYEIDLSAKNAAKLRTALSPFVGSGSRVSGRAAGAPTARGHRAATVEREQNKAIRAWAQRNGHDVAPRGRIRQEIVDLYHREAGR